jgi:hypothetical protein
VLHRFKIAVPFVIAVLVLVAALQVTGGPGVAEQLHASGEVLYFAQSPSSATPCPNDVVVNPLLAFLMYKDTGKTPETMWCTMPPICSSADVDCSLESCNACDAADETYIYWWNLTSLPYYQDVVEININSSSEQSTTATPSCKLFYDDETDSGWISSSTNDFDIEFDFDHCTYRTPTDYDSRRVQNDLTFHDEGYDSPCWTIGGTNTDYLTGMADGNFAVFDYNYQHHNGYGNGEIIVDFGEMIKTNVYGTLEVKTKNPAPGKYALFAGYGVVYYWHSTLGWQVVTDSGNWWASNGWGPELEIGAIETQYLRFQFLGPWNGEEIDAASGIDSIRIGNHIPYVP